VEEVEELGNGKLRPVGFVLVDEQLGCGDPLGH